MRKLKLWLNSLRFKLFSGLLFTIVPLIIVLLIINHYSAQVVRNQVAQSNKNMLSLYMGQIDRNLQEVDNFLINLSQTNLDLLDLDTDRIANENNYMKAKLRLFQTINNSVSYYKGIDSFFIYSSLNKDLLMTQGFGSSFDERNQVANEIVKMLQDSSVTPNVYRWYTWQSDGNHYVYHVIKTGDVYVGAWVDAKKLMIPLQLIDLGSNGAALLTSERLEPMSHGELIAQKGIHLALTNQAYTLSGTNADYLVMGEPSKKGNFYLFALIPEETALEKLPYLQRISSIISIGAIVFLLIFVFYMRKVFLLPINRIILAMRKLGDGRWNSQIEHYPTSTEFSMMNETYNRMITEIQHLKINVYEEKLMHQHAELKHLQLQINPHFFLNSLNIVYNLATVKDFKLIQEMTKCLVAYFRFMFRSNSYLVTLKDELLHTQNYLRIQELRFPGILSYQIEAPDVVLSLQIPPLVIQTMVENAIKHAVNMDEQIRIDIRVNTEEDEENQWVVIHIEDTGAGFPDPILELLQSNMDLTSEEGEHIGIWNVKRRLHLLYSDKAAIDFYNEVGKGACVRIRIPADVPPIGGE
ncbi:histidine kinase [Paenibacillus alginolyticus]|uniref:sensor histidine kinase n=1 Tax=Paenibacillus alginolyticus TaxID=59839 RepID=UPI000407808C|nr:histidine kinase [Paenibacillus alginolyticus]MCY9668868.1 histidine kinase [Paenibacillus alginolyticus]